MSEVKISNEKLKNELELINNYKKDLEEILNEKEV